MEIEPKDIVRFWDKVEVVGNCFVWMGSKRKGYGRFKLNGKSETAHRISYEMFKGDIPKNHIIDHLCKNPNCVNPVHLEVVTQKENVRRGNASKSQNLSHCPHGHEYTIDNTYTFPDGRKRCRQCHNNERRKYALVVKQIRN